MLPDDSFIESHSAGHLGYRGYKQSGDFPGGLVKLRLHIPNARGTGLIHDWGTKIPHALDKINKNYSHRVGLCAMVSHFSHVWLFTTLWIVACQAPLSMGFSRQEYWSGLLCPPPGDLPNPGIESKSLMSPALAGGFFTTSAALEALGKCIFSI